MEVRAREGLRPLGVYVHVPWCASKCPYCDFNSTVLENGSSSRVAAEKAYFGALASELRHRACETGLAGSTLESLYFGGGTPTVVAASSIASVIDTAAGLFSLGGDAEITVEANPDSATAGKLRDLRAAGAGRLSLGVQSLEAGLLDALGRPHSPEDALRAFGAARDAGFEDVGVDLIFALPGQTLSGWEDALRRAVALAPEHISVYGLTIEAGTPYSALYGPCGPRRDEVPDTEAQAAMYELAVDMLSGEGYLHYEISNFARPGRESRHNSGYWLGRDYIGVGAGAHSYLSEPGWGARWWNVADPGLYARLARDKGEAAEGSEELTREEAFSEAVMLGLRMCRAGLDAAALAVRFGPGAAGAVAASLEPLARAGLVEEAGGGWRLAGRGMLLADSVVEAVAGALADGETAVSPGGAECLTMGAMPEKP